MVLCDSFWGDMNKCLFSQVEYQWQTEKISQLKPDVVNQWMSPALVNVSFLGKEFLKILLRILRWGKNSGSLMRA